MSKKALPKMVHYHVYSNDRLETGVLELTYRHVDPTKVRLKVADNRKSRWSISALEALTAYLTSFFSRSSRFSGSVNIRSLP